jgi:hypothetical protein
MIDVSTGANAPRRDRGCRRAETKIKGADGAGTQT